MSFFITTPYSISDLKPLKKAGSDGIIIGTPFFSARAAVSFAFDELPKLREEATRLHLKMFVLVNRMFSEDELEHLKKYLVYLKELQVDGIYFCDEGVLAIAQDLDMVALLIYQPDTLVTNASDVNYYLHEGLQMVTLAKEITLDEICAIAKASCGNKIEVIIHGRQNMMHSKRNLLSSYVKHIQSDADIRNKQTLYLREETRDEHYPIIEDDLGTHVFTGFTMASFGEIQAMVNAGVENFRIDGIFHDVDYLCEALSIYHAIVNGEVDGQVMFDEYCTRYPQDHVTKGFLYQWTGLHKEQL